MLLRVFLYVFARVFLCVLRFTSREERGRGCRRNDDPMSVACFNLLVLVVCLRCHRGRGKGVSRQLKWLLFHNHRSHGQGSTTAPRCLPLNGAAATVRASPKPYGMGIARSASTQDGLHPPLTTLFIHLPKISRNKRAGCGDAPHGPVPIRRGGGAAQSAHEHHPGERRATHGGGPPAAADPGGRRDRLRHRRLRDPPQRDPRPEGEPLPIFARVIYHFFVARSGSAWMHVRRQY